MSGTTFRPEFPHEGGTRANPKTKAWRGLLLPLGFLAPAIFFLGVWVVYPTFATMVRSLYSDRGDRFVGIDNYRRLFSDDIIFTAIKNNFLWVLFIPLGVTAVGLVFAVLTERVRWAVAFKVAVFIPLAVSLFAVGVIWRIMYQQDPERGVVNAAIVAVQGVVSERGVLASARPSTDTITGTPAGGLTLQETIEPGDVALLGLTAIPPREVPEGAVDARAPEPLQGGITGVVWRDFSPGGGTPGEVEPGELGIPGVTVELRAGDGRRALTTTTTGEDGTFAFEDVEGGAYRVAIGSKTFAEPFAGFNWLGPSLITPAIMLSYIWVSAGFAMVIIAAGLAAIPRDTIEAARTDGATEFQIFKRITIPQLMPVLTVVFVTQIIACLKIFDLVLAIAPGSSRNDATLLAFEMWRRAFSGQNLFGLGSAISTFLLLLFIPFLIVNVRRFRAEAR
ncbi:MAG TPA: ABC transporter permease subunit [Gaiellaceae bacterium]|nr:ABC transporter permease subunit [Gaiellaceae bacterium]